MFITKNKMNHGRGDYNLYNRTHEGWIYLAIILDLFSRKIIGWATNHRITTNLIIHALKILSIEFQKKE